MNNRHHRLYKILFLDFYLVTSREEGGPMGLLESLSTGIKVITTNVGMAPDFIDKNNVNVEIEVPGRRVLRKNMENL